MEEGEYASLEPELEVRETSCAAESAVQGTSIGMKGYTS
jgi:hypothetical protein